MKNIILLCIGMLSLLGASSCCKRNTNQIPLPQFVKDAFPYQAKQQIRFVGSRWNDTLIFETGELQNRWISQETFCGGTLSCSLCGEMQVREQLIGLLQSDNMAVNIIADLQATSGISHQFSLKIGNATFHLLDVTDNCQFNPCEDMWINGYVYDEVANFTSFNFSQGFNPIELSYDREFGIVRFMLPDSSTYGLLR